MFAKNSFNIPKQLFRQFFTRIFSNRYPCSFLSRARGPAVTWLNEAHSFLLRFLIALPRWQNKFLRLRLFAVVPSTKWNFKVNICRPLLCYDDKTKFERVVEVWKKTSHARENTIFFESHHFVRHPNEFIRKCGIYAHCNVLFDSIFWNVDVKLCR